MFFRMIFTASPWASLLWPLPGSILWETQVLIFGFSLHLPSLLERLHWEPPLKSFKEKKKAINSNYVGPQCQMPLLAPPPSPPSASSKETLAQDRAFAVSPGAWPFKPLREVAGQALSLLRAALCQFLSKEIAVLFPTFGDVAF